MPGFNLGGQRDAGLVVFLLSLHAPQGYNEQSFYLKGRASAGEQKVISAYDFIPQRAILIAPFNIKYLETRP